MPRAHGAAVSEPAWHVARERRFPFRVPSLYEEQMERLHAERVWLGLRGATCRGASKLLLGALDAFPEWAPTREDESHLVLLVEAVRRNGPTKREGRVSQAVEGGLAAMMLIPSSGVHTRQPDLPEVLRTVGRYGGLSDRAVLDILQRQV